MLRSALAAVLCLLVAPGVAAAQGPPPPDPDGPRVLLAFLPGRTKGAQTKVILDRFDKRPSLALGMLSSTTGRYDAAQTLLDITQGTRTSFNVYKPKLPPELALVRFQGGGAIAGWFDALRRAESAPETIEPGLLASSIPGGAGYVGVGGKPNLTAVAAADEEGRIAALSLGSRQTLVPRTQAMLARKRYVVVGLPSRRAGGRALDELLAARRPNELLIVIRTPPTESAAVLLPIGIAGLGRGNLVSDTSRHAGLVAGIDLLPTILEHLGLPVPDDVRGQPIRAEAPRDVDAILDFEKRSRTVSPRRLPTLMATFLGWLGLTLLLGVIRGPPGTRRGMRIGGLAAMWLPAVLLIPAAFQPTKNIEMAIVAGAALLLGALTDLLLRWPRGPMLPAAAVLLAYTVDLARGSDLIVRSLLGPNPRFGSRFYGLGNELEATLPILALVGLAAVPFLRDRSRLAAAVFAGAGLALGAIIGAGRLGADVGGVITVGAGFAVATVMMLPGRLSVRRLVAVVAVPVAALLLLAAIDLATGGNSHFSRSVLGAQGTDELWNTVSRRYELAFNVLRRGLMPVLTVLALLAAAYGVRHRRTLLAPLEGAAAWHAALAGALAGSIAGALTNDSGPLLVVFGVALLAFVVAYVRGDPRLVGPPPAPAQAAPEAAPEPVPAAEKKVPEPAAPR